MLSKDDRHFVGIMMVFIAAMIIIIMMMLWAGGKL